MELNESQKKIVETKEKYVIVNSCAAVGKTTVLVERTKFLLNSGVSPSKIVLITFTNAAAEEMYIRLGKPSGLFIGTIHSYANFLLLSKGIDTQDCIDNENFDELFEMIKKNKECIEPVDYLMLDESQDSNSKQLEFLLDMVKPKNYLLIGDHRQSIYRWNGAQPENILEMQDDFCVHTFLLRENYRNGRKILDFAKDIIKGGGVLYRDVSLPMRGIDGEVVNIDYSNKKIVDMIENSSDQYKDWFILTRTNAQSDTISSLLQKNKIPCDSFKRSQLDNKQLYEKMEENTVKVLTIHTSKGLEAKNVIVIGAKKYNIEERCISYVAATRARDLLVWVDGVKNRTKKIEMMDFCTPSPKTYYTEKCIEYQDEPMAKTLCDSRYTDNFYDNKFMI